MPYVTPAQFVHRAAHLFFFCFLLSLSNLFDNLRGGDGAHGGLSFSTLVLQTTLGNLQALTVPTAVIELAIGGLLLRFLYFARVEQLAEAEEARTSQVTPSDLSAMPGWPDARMAGCPDGLMPGWPDGLIA